MTFRDRTKEILQVCGVWYKVHFLACGTCDFKSDTENEMVEHFIISHEDIVDDCYRRKK